MRKVQRMLQVPYTLTLMNWAVIAGLFHYLNRHQEFWDLALPASKGKPVTPQLRQL